MAAAEVPEEGTTVLGALQEWQPTQSPRAMASYVAVSFSFLGTPPTAMYLCLSAATSSHLSLGPLCGPQLPLPA